MEPHRTIEGGADILVVEDEVELQRLAVRVLERAGYRPVGATTAAQAGRRVADLGAPALLFTDVMLPDDDGIALAARLCDRFPGLPVLVSTGQPLTWITDAVADGGYSFLPKPYTPSRLLAIVGELIGQPAA